MIAIGGAIGTGLFLGSGSAIHSAGPSIILSYLIVGIITFFMMRALGELILADPDSHSFLESIKKYLGKRAEFVAGWTYWACWLSLAMADLTATGIYLRYWFPWLPQWVGSLVIVVLLMLINMVNVGLFGELESWFSMIKVIAIVALIVTGAVMIVLQTKVKGGTVSLTNLVSHGGFFPTGIWGFLLSFQMVVFAFVGVEIVVKLLVKQLIRIKIFQRQSTLCQSELGFSMLDQCWLLCQFIHGTKLKRRLVRLSKYLQELALPLQQES